jgi:hypothetical protein
MGLRLSIIMFDIMAHRDRGGTITLFAVRLVQLNSLCYC